MEPSVEETGGDKQTWAELDSLAAARSGQRPPSEEVLASLAAVRNARDAAQSRMRRDSRRVRLLTAALLAAIAVGTFAAAGQIRAKRRHARAMAAAPSIALSSIALSPAAPLATAEIAPRAVQRTGEDTTPTNIVAPSAVAAPAPVAGDVPAAGDLAWVGPEATAERERVLAACTDAYNRHRWRSAAETCGAAFEAQSRDATLAMKVAQAQHARSHYADAAVWARRAIALDGVGADVDPEAFVIVAHAERRARNPVAARTAYRRYLALAPRGWHAAEARAALPTRK